ncbi:MAG: hypothetical protein U5K31_11605 [Balneolaceae bacterium]|nr:hypothetical protein [Balneolaceae bacterium]
MIRRTILSGLCATLMLLLGMQGAALAQDGFAETDSSHKDLPLKPERTVRVQSDEATWLSIDVHPDGTKMIFDMMGDLYELPIEGESRPG